MIGAIILILKSIIIVHFTPSFPHWLWYIRLHMQDTVDVVRSGMPSKTFSEMMAVLRKFVSFMNLTVSGSALGLLWIRMVCEELD